VVCCNIVQRRRRRQQQRHRHIWRAKWALVQLQTNIPVEAALKYSDGKDVTGQYGDQVLYTLSDGRVIYVPSIVKKKIEKAGIARGELFSITKAERKNGTRRTIEWPVAADAQLG
jgi:hypothetical protein